MYCLIRRVTGRGRESLEYRDVELVTDRLTIGSAADQGVTLTGADIESHHATVSLKPGGKLELRAASSTASLTVNGEEQRQAVLKPGDEIGIGANRLVILPDQPGFELAVQVEAARSGDEAEVSTGAFIKQRAQYTWISKRGLAWILSLTVLVFALLIPLAGLMDEDVNTVLRDSHFLPSDNAWSTGPLAGAHRTPDIATECEACHLKAFEQVPNRACHACHDNIRHHVSSDSEYQAALTDRQCQSCHKEHKEPGQIVRRDQGLCNDCHSDESLVESESAGFGVVEDFADAHPDFRLTMLTLEDGATEDSRSEPLWRVEKVRRDKEPLEEHSNLKFNHKVHLDPEGVKLLDGSRQVMDCADCHTEDAAGRLMKPFTMAGECKSCHNLQFKNSDSPEGADDPLAGREVPHGSVDLVLATLVEYYSKRGLESTPAVKRPGTRERKPRRRKNSDATREPDEVLAWARQQADITAKILIEDSACATCHEVITKSGEDGKQDSWEIVPVRVNHNWMPDASFTHRAHATFECKECHNAAESEESTQVLMPGIDTCRNCHGGAGSTTKLDSRCVDCHLFHNPAMDLLYTGPEPANGHTPESPIEELSRR